MSVQVTSAHIACKNICSNSALSLEPLDLLSSLTEFHLHPALFRSTITVINISVISLAWRQISKTR